MNTPRTWMIRGIEFDEEELDERLEEFCNSGQAAGSPW